MYMEWSDQKYATGVPEVDEQHKELFNQLNKLLSAMKAGKGKEEIEKIVAFLESYVKEHFRCEERHMDRIKCSACAENKAAHAKFLADFADIKNRLKTEGSSGVIAIDVQRKLCDWLATHIQRIDATMRNHV